MFLVRRGRELSSEQFFIPPGVTLPLSSFLSFSQEIAGGISDTFRDPFTSTTTIKCFRGVHLDLPKALLLHADSSKTTLTALVESETKSLKITFKEGSNLCFRTVLTSDEDVRQNPGDIPDVSRLEKNHPWNETGDEPSALYKEIFHTLQFQVGFFWENCALYRPRGRRDPGRVDIEVVPVCVKKSPLPSRIVWAVCTDGRAARTHFPKGIHRLPPCRPKRAPVKVPQPIPPADCRGLFLSEEVWVARQAGHRPGHATAEHGKS